ncbi:Ribosomal RNA processing protein 36 like protein [Eufriesea mexicana]|nr:Ribosomal RNA processing protein 36 like protein [Eufriesea mexicana]
MDTHKTKGVSVTNLESEFKVIRRMRLHCHKALPFKLMSNVLDPYVFFLAKEKHNLPIAVPRDIADQIRAELSQISFEDLQKLKEKLGVKVYKETLFGPRKVKQVDFKRENKNRPRELSAKKPISRFREVIQVKKNIPRDPRFDSLCGTFDKKRFNKAYSFLSDVKKNDLEKLKKKLKGSEKRVLDLISQYEELKSTGKLKKHIKRLRKKNLQKDRQKLASVEHE